MASIKESNLGLNYGWAYGESGWNTGMDDNLVKLGFESRKRINGILSSPPSAPSNGDAYIVGTAPTGLFSGKFANIAIYDRSSWVFIAPKSQEVVFNTSDGCDYIYNNGWSLKLEAEVSPYIKVKDFTFSTGYTITDQRQCLLNIVDNNYYQWNGTLPKVVPAGSTPATSGGIGAGAWVDRTDASLRGDLAKPTGASLIGIHDTTVGDILKQNVYIIVITGQSNAVGANRGGPNPGNPKVKVWNPRNSSWGSSDFTKNPFAYSSPDGNSGNNNIALSFAHRLVDEHKADKVYIIYDAASGRPIEDWISSGVSSVRYAAIKGKVEAALSSPEIIASGKTKIDFLVFAQGEENALTDTVTDYRTKLATLDKQFRAESWMSDTTPMFIMGMSGLHARYQVWQAQVDYCENYNRNCIYVNSAGLKTQYDVDQTGDYTHWLGESLWEHGYYRIWQALHERGVTHRQALPAFYSRGVGIWNGDNTAIAGFSSLISAGSTTSDFPKNGSSASHAISWGYQCTAANYSLAGGYQNTMETGANYSVSWGRLNAFAAPAQYSTAFGYGNTINAPYAFAAGRGHTIADPNCAAIGAFSEYKTSLSDPVRFQVGIGTSAASPKTGFAVFESGRALFSGNIDFRTDNAFSVGAPSARASVIYSATANINTSDITTKKIRGSSGALTDAELRAWAKVPPTIYQIRESLNEKGEDARLHAGLIAQDVATAFESEGLDPRRYALFCEDEIFEEVFEPQVRTVSRQKRGPGVIRESGIVDGVEVTVERRVEDALQYKLVNDEFVTETEEVEETVMIPVRKSAGIRLGLRYTECLIFEAAYQRSVSTKLAARLDEIEIGMASLNQ